MSIWSTGRNYRHRPYIPYSDSIPDLRGGFAAEEPEVLGLTFSQQAQSKLAQHCPEARHIILKVIEAWAKILALPIRRQKARQQGIICGKFVYRSLTWNSLLRRFHQCNWHWTLLRSQIGWYYMRLYRMLLPIAAVNLLLMMKLDTIECVPANYLLSLKETPNDAEVTSATSWCYVRVWSVS